jgi:TPR repeat protein
MAVEIANEVEKDMLSEGANSAYAKSCALLAQKSAMDMAYRKDAQPQIIEIFGKKVKIVEHISEPTDCMKCAFIGFCLNSSLNICQNAE